MILKYETLETITTIAFHKLSNKKPLRRAVFLNSTPSWILTTRKPALHFKAPPCRFVDFLEHTGWDTLCYGALVKIRQANSA